MASIREHVSTSGERTWKVLYRHGGRQTSRTYTTEKRAVEAKSLIDLLGPDKALKVLAEQAPDNRLTVEELARKFLAWKVRDVTPRTLTQYRRDVDNWILPWLGHRAAESVDEADVQKWVDGMAARLSPKSVADRHMLLHSMYKWGRAKSRRLVEHNPCEETELPKRTKKPPKGTTVAEFAALLAAAERRNPDAADLICFLGETGWRWSEAAGLLVRNVLDDGRDVWVNMRDVFRIDGDGRQVLTTDAAKSEAGFRRIRLLPASAAVVRTRIVGRGAGDFVFTNSRGNPWNQHTFLTVTWPRIVADAGLADRKPTPHWLRHMHVAVLAAAGVSPHEIQRRIGHEHIETTYGVYGGMMGDMPDDSLATVAAIMSGKRSAPGVAPVVRGEVVRELD